MKATNTWAFTTFNLSGTDPLYSYQWHLNNTGQKTFSEYPGIAGEDMNMLTTVSEGYTGKGIKVAVLDSGLEIAHEDLSANIISGGSWDFVGGDTDPTPTSTGV